MLFQATALSRSLLGAGFLFSAAYSQTMPLALLWLGLAAAGLCVSSGGIRLLQRAGRAVAWIAVPMILVHGLFTPGELLPVVGVFSYEGLRAGGWLALHFGAIFVVALFAFRLLRQEEWMRLMFISPALAHRILPYLLLMEPLRRSAQVAVRRHRRRWHRRRNALDGLGAMLLLSTRAVLRAGRREAGELWATWDETVARLMMRLSFPAGAVSPLMTLLCIATAVGMLLISVEWG